jgi:hypothetical protein
LKHRFAQDHIILSSITNRGDILLRASFEIRAGCLTLWSEQAQLRFAATNLAVIPAKGGIQPAWVPVATRRLAARLRGHDGWNLRLVSIRIRYRNYE